MFGLAGRRKDIRDDIDDSRVRIGKNIVVTIATILIVQDSVLLLFDLFLLHDTLGVTQAGIRIAFTVAFLRGKTWARYFVAVGAALGVVLVIYELYSVTNDTPEWLIAYCLIMLPFCILTSVLLFFSKSVSAYFN